MAIKRVFNPGDQPVVIDDEGRGLGGGEWADLDTSSDLIQSLLDREQLLVPADIPATQQPAAPVEDTTTTKQAPVADSKPSTTKTKE